jgi:hypothetical protein
MGGHHEFFPDISYKMYHASYNRPPEPDSVEAANLMAAHTPYADTIIYPGRLTAYGNGSGRAGLLTLKTSSAPVFYQLWFNGKLTQ